MTLVCDSSLLVGNGWPFPVDRLPSASYLVGGAVRDALLGRRVSYLDLDFVMPGDAIATARAIAQEYGSGFVVLDAERGIARVVFKDGTADFARQVGPTLETDLHRRDFTINAIAVQPHGGEAIDPFDGQRDLERRTMRMISPENLREDPLRLLRAYRQCAQLDLQLEPETQESLRSLAALLKTVAAERVMSEIRGLLSAPGGARWGRVAWQDGVLQDWLPSLGAGPLDLADRIDGAIATLAPHWKNLPQAMDAIAAGDTNTNATEGYGSTMVKLAAWLAPNPTQASQTLQILKTSRHEQRIVEGILKGMQTLSSTIAGSQFQPRTAPLAIAEQFNLFRVSHGTFPLVAVLAIAAGTPREILTEPIQRWHTPNDPTVHPQPILSGRELLKTYGPTQGRSPGPWVGELLSALAIAHAESKIQTLDDAHQFIQVWLEGAS